MRVIPTTKACRFYYQEGDPDKMVKEKEKWLELDPEVEFVEYGNEAHLTKEKDGSDRKNKDTSRGEGILHMYIPHDNTENKPSSLNPSTSCLQVVYKYGDIASPFDDYLSTNPEWHNIKDVARICQSSFDNRSFIQLLYRRVHTDNRVQRRGDKIRWINNDWKSYLMDAEASKRTPLNLALPFGAEKYISTSEGVEIVLGGDIGSGKTHWGFTIADLNLGKLPIRHFIVEDGDQRSLRLLEDYPLLEKAFYAGDQNYYLINPSKNDGGLNIIESLDPYGLNIWDYYRLTKNTNWYLDLQHTLIEAGDKIETGGLVVMLQKAEGMRLPYGKEFTTMHCEVAFVLHKDKNVSEDERDYGHKECHIIIEKAKEYAGRQNPEVLGCGYKTAPKHGKLIPYSQGWVHRSNFES